MDGLLLKKLIVVVANNVLARHQICVFTTTSLTSQVLLGMKIFALNVLVH